MKKIYIAGCGGMLGEAFYNHFINSYLLKCTDIDVNDGWLGYLDFRNFQEYLKDVESFGPDYLFHLGALTDLEYCEANINDAYATNTMAVENAVYIANKLNIPILYISTAGIFDGQKEYYDDWDVPNPLGHYARSKYYGEIFVQQNTSKHLICRAGWMMGGGVSKDKKFISKIMKQLKSGKKELFIVNDKLGTPTYTHAFANQVDLLLKNEYWGLYNVVCEGVTSRLEVTKHLLKILNIDTKIKITEKSSEYFSKEYYAPRPDCERLINKKIELRGLPAMPSWQKSLEEYIKKYYHNYL